MSLPSIYPSNTVADFEIAPIWRVTRCGYGHHFSVENRLSLETVVRNVERGFARDVARVLNGQEALVEDAEPGSYQAVAYEVVSQRLARLTDATRRYVQDTLEARRLHGTVAEVAVLRSHTQCSVEGVTMCYLSHEDADEWWPVDAKRGAMALINAGLQVAPGAFFAYTIVGSRS